MIRCNGGQIRWKKDISDCAILATLLKCTGATFTTAWLGKYEMICLLRPAGAVDERPAETTRADVQDVRILVNL